MNPNYTRPPVAATAYNHLMACRPIPEELEALFHPAVMRWFCDSFGTPTPAQAMAWPPIARGENTLVLAPTGSGKTLAAFLVAIDRLLRRTGASEGVEILYVSPLKALGYDIERNLETPLAGIRATASALGMSLPKIAVGVRTGDTTAAQRRRLVRVPPDILITTPESLHLMLTSVSARATLGPVRCVIVDEVHAVSESKRGAFLSVVLERLESHAGTLQRVGLSATQRPLGRLAAFLGGMSGGRPRPVTRIDAGRRRAMDLRVLVPVADMRELPDGTIWPSLYARLLELVLAHRTTLVFVNSRRVAERVTSELNELAGHELARAHHGSVAVEARHELEVRLKSGELPCLVATGSLELGIDMGAVDLVCQVEAPRGVARALQRVGRSGHAVHATARGRLLAKTRGDLLELAATSEAMAHAAIAPTRIVEGALDVLAQQVVAIAADGPVSEADLLLLLRRSYPYRTLTEETLRGALAMLSGRLTGPWGMRPRVSWDRTAGLVVPTPGTRRIAVLGGGAIPDRGQYGVHTERGDRIGELDEEFVFEARVGECLRLGSDIWRITSIDEDRVVVAPGRGPAKMPFWRGEGLGRDPHLGRQVGRLARRIEDLTGDPQLPKWLMETCALDEAAAANLTSYVQTQGRISAVPTDRRAVLEAFPDGTGGRYLALLSPFGSRFHLGLRLALLAWLRRQHGARPESLHTDDGILFRLVSLSAGDVAGALARLRATELEDLIVEEAAGSPFLGLAFRDAAARALLLPPRRPGRRNPLWLRRAAARDLLEALGTEPDHPLRVEAYRELLADVLPLGALRAYLCSLDRGKRELVERSTQAPSPFASALVFQFQAAHIYEWDAPRAVPGSAAHAAQEAMFELRELGPGVDPAALAELESQLAGRARSGGELVELVRRLGDLGRDERDLLAESDALRALPGLLERGALAHVRFPGREPEERLVAGEDLPLYREALAGDGAAQAEILRRHVGGRVLVSEETLVRRYGFPEIAEALRDPPFVAISWQGTQAWGRKEALRRLHTRSVTRREAHPPEALQTHVLRRQHRTRGAQLSGEEGIARALGLLQGRYLPWPLWDGETLATRVRGHRVGDIDVLLRSGRFVWAGRPGPQDGLHVAFFDRDCLPGLLGIYPPGAGSVNEVASDVEGVLRVRGASFLIELARELGIPSIRCARGLWELARAGRVTSDALGALTAGPPSEAPRRRVWGGAEGRWSLLPETTASEPPTLKKLADLLLARYGVVSRGVLAADGAAVPWGALYQVLQRREWAGRLVRGVLVDGLAGAQFASPDTEADLHARDTATDELISVVDPALLWGSALPLPKTGGTGPISFGGPGAYVALVDARPRLLVGGGGARLLSLEPDRGIPERALALLPSLLDRGLRRVVVRTWNGESVLDSEVREPLGVLGFQQGAGCMILYRSYTSGGVQGGRGR